jgi:hypothetical protein
VTAAGPGDSRVSDAGGHRRLRPLDWTVLVNGALFGAMVALFYWDRFEAHRRSANVREFFVYACVFALLIGWLWWWLRRFPVRWRLLIAGESALLLHFAGGVSIRPGMRLYDVWLLHVGDMRFDKLVHVLACIVVGFIVGAVLRAYDVRLGRVRVIAMILIISGIGALWEICEYVVVSNFPDAGVGGYDNNMQDMIANLGGAFVYALLPSRWRAAIEDPPGVTEGTP